MLDGQAVVKVLNWWMRSQKLEVVNHSEDDNIFVHEHIVSIKYVYFLSSPTKHKNLSTNRVLNDSCQILWSEKVTNSGPQQSIVGPGECSIPKVANNIIWGPGATLSHQNARLLALKWLLPK